MRVGKIGAEMRVGKNRGHGMRDGGKTEELIYITKW